MNDAESMKTAAQLIRAGKLAAARALLSDVQEPEHRAKAREWIGKIDAMMPAAMPQQATAPEPAYPPQGAAQAPVPDFSTKALGAFLLMWFFLVPGWIAAMVWYGEARRVEERTGIKPEGMGALWAMRSIPLYFALAAAIFLVVVVVVSFIATNNPEYQAAGLQLRLTVWCTQERGYPGSYCGDWVERNLINADAIYCNATNRGNDPGFTACMLDHGFLR